MAIYYGINSSYASTLFSSLNTSNNSFSNLSGLMQDYAGIKNGSYGKLLRKYYSSDSTTEDTSSAKKDKYTTTTSKDSTKTLKAVEQNTEELKSSADKLIKAGTGSVFQKTNVTDENGKETRTYDKDKIYSAVKDFVSNYNRVLDTTDDVRTSSIKSNRNAMMNITKANAALLSSTGITADKDGRLSMDETKFKSSDMSAAKSLFNGTGSYAYQVSAKASMINYNAETEQKKANTYTNNGAYSYNYSAGSLYDDMF